MRLLVDTLICLMLAGILGFVLVHTDEQASVKQKYASVQKSLGRLQEQVVYRRAMDSDADVAAAQWPALISPAWFGEELPLNPLVSSRNPWIDVAPVGDLALHPPDPIITRDAQAGFWYNPNNGVFRARIRPGFTDQETLQVYNQVNSTGLAELPESRDLATRKPQRMFAKATPRLPERASVLSQVKPQAGGKPQTAARNAEPALNRLAMPSLKNTQPAPAPATTFPANATAVVPTE